MLCVSSAVSLSNEYNIQHSQLDLDLDLDLYLVPDLDLDLNLWQDKFKEWVESWAVDDAPLHPRSDHVDGGS